MTVRHYLSSDDLSITSKVIRCTPTEDGKFEIVLSSTVFHPQGGGQPSDQGTIAGATVLRVTQAGDEVVHVCDRAVELGDAQIDVSPEVRTQHARLHSAGHLIGFCGEQFGWHAVKGHHWPGEARVIFEPDAGATEMTGEVIELEANAHVAANLQRNTTQDGDKRSIGFGPLPAYSCGGTHVRWTAEIGKIAITKVKEKKGQLWVHYDLD